MGYVQLFRHCSGIFRCSAGVLCLFAQCSGVPGFIVCPKNIVSLLITFCMFSNSSVFIKVKLETIFVNVNRISGELRCYNILTIARKNPLAFNNIFCCSNIFEWDFQLFAQALKALYSEDGTNTKRLEITTYKCFLDFLETCNFDGVSRSRL